MPEAWRRYSARTLTDLTAQDLLRAGETAAFLQSQPALTVDYLTAAVTDAPGGVELTEDGLQIVQTLLRSKTLLPGWVGAIFRLHGRIWNPPLRHRKWDTLRGV